MRPIVIITGLPVEFICVCVCELTSWHAILRKHNGIFPSFMIPRNTSGCWNPSLWKTNNLPPYLARPVCWWTEPEQQQSNLACNSFPLSFQLKNVCYINKSNVALTHWGRGKMAAIFQATSSNAFSWMKVYEFRLRFHWSVFLRVLITIFQHWFWWWLGAGQATSHYLNQCWFVYWCIYVSLGLNELRFTCGNITNIACTSFSKTK